MVNYESESIIQVPIYNITAIKIPVNEIIDISRFYPYEERYSQTNLLRIYQQRCGIIPQRNLNYFINNKYVYIIPETGLGIEEDLNLIMGIINNS